MKSLSLRFTLLIASLLIFVLSGSAQGTARTVTFSKFTVQEGYTENDVAGLRLQFDMSFNWLEEFAERNFTVSYRMLQGGNTVLPSVHFTSCEMSAYVSEQVVKGKPGMVRTGNSIFIPYYVIPLESGAQTVELVFSVNNSAGKYSDCFRKSVTFQHKKIVQHPSHEQGFAFSNFKLDYAAKSFGGNVPGMKISNAVGFKFGKQESLDERYEVALLLRGASGKLLYDSRKAEHGGDKTQYLRIESLEGKPSTTSTFFASYYDIAMEGPGEAEVVYVLLGAEGGPKEIFAQKMMLNIPPSYNFEEQSFTPQSVKVTATEKNGVAGIGVQYSVAFKQTGILRNHEKGMYYFYAAIFDETNKLVIAPERAPTAYAGTTHLQDGQMPSAENTVAQGSLFIPMHLINATTGAHNLKFALMVSDVNLKTKFPIIQSGIVAVTKPNDHQYLLSLEQLDMINANYDAELVPVSSNLPELQYSFAVGDDQYYASEYTRNSLSAIPSSATVHLSEGDPIHLILQDVDSGFFNDNDLLGNWKIDYAGKGDSFYYEVNNTGQVVKLRLKVTRVK